MTKVILLGTVYRSVDNSEVRRLLYVHARDIEVRFFSRDNPPRCLPRKTVPDVRSRDGLQCLKVNFNR